MNGKMLWPDKVIWQNTLKSNISKCDDGQNLTTRWKDSKHYMRNL